MFACAYILMTVWAVLAGLLEIVVEGWNFHRTGFLAECIKKETSWCIQINLYSPLHEGRPVVIVVGGWNQNGASDAKDKTEMLDYTQTNSEWVEGSVLFPKLFWWSRKAFDIRGSNPRIFKNVDITRSICSNNESSEQFLK